MVKFLLVIILAVLAVAAVGTFCGPVIFLSSFDQVDSNMIKSTYKQMQQAGYDFPPVVFVLPARGNMNWGGRFVMVGYVKLHPHQGQWIIAHEFAHVSDFWNGQGYAHDYEAWASEQANLLERENYNVSR